MSAIRILIVDDDVDLLEEIKQELDELASHIEVWTTTEPREARRLVDKYKYDIAFVDIYYKDPDRVERPEGIDLVRYIRDRAPGCKQVLMTRLAEDGWSLILELMNEMQPSPPQLINKSAELRTYFTDAVHLHFERQLNARWSVPDVTAAASHLACAPRPIKGLRTGSVPEIALELERLLFALFDEAISADFLAEPPSLQVEKMHLGESGSIVLQTYLEFSVDEGDERVAGTRCVVKINDRQSISEEEKRYRELVRMGVPSEFRVELLEVAYSDALAAICYSFAGGTQDEPARTFDALALDEPASAKKVISTLFDSTHTKWDAIRGKARRIEGFYNREFGTEMTKQVREMHSFVGQSGIGSLDTSTGTWTLGTLDLQLPLERDLGEGAWKRTSPSRLVHGDLHGGNLMIGTDLTVYMIDFANVSLGPRFADAAALAASVRMQRAKSETMTVRQIQQLFKTEERLLEKLHVGEGFPTSVPSWAGLADHINVAALARVANRNGGQIILREYVMTQLSCALNSFSIPWFSSHQKIHLLLWSAALRRYAFEVLR